jgi:hypothetical protein
MTQPPNGGWWLIRIDGTAGASHLSGRFSRKLPGWPELSLQVGLVKPSSSLGYSLVQVLIALFIEA